MSQNAFAKKVGLASSTISDWKTQKTNPSADKIMDICTALEVTPEQLLTWKGIDEDYVDYKTKKAQNVPAISKVDARILEDIHGAEQQSIFIMRAFREMRHYIKQNQQFVTQAG